MKDSNILILGSNGQLGKQFQKELTARGMKFFAPEEKDCEITNFAGIERFIGKIAPDTIVNCAAYNAVDEAELNDSLADLINNKAVENIARICKQNGIFLVHYSTDYVFDGRKGDMYFEEDIPNPINAYGRSKWAGERAVLDILSNSLVLRPSWVYGEGRQNFIYKLLEWASKNRVLKISCDEVSVPTSTTELASISIDLICRKMSGLFHLTNSGYSSRYEWARFVLETLNMENIVIPVPMSSFKSAANRPQFAAMSNNAVSKLLNRQIPDWKISLKSYLIDKYANNHKNEEGALEGNQRGNIA